MRVTRASTFTAQPKIRVSARHTMDCCKKERITTWKGGSPASEDAPDDAQSLGIGYWSLVIEKQERMRFLLHNNGQYPIPNTQWENFPSRERIAGCWVIQKSTS